MSALRQSVYNKDLDECKWPTNLAGREANNCNFNLVVIQDLNIPNVKAKFVKIPKNTLLYHKTIAFKSFWWKTEWPVNNSVGGVFFTTEFHHGNIAGTHLLVYNTKKDINLVYIQNIANLPDVNTGNDFLCHHYKIVKELAEKQSGKSIDGYIGCNECEIFIENESIVKCLYKEPVIITDVSKYID